MVNNPLTNVLDFEQQELTEQEVKFLYSFFGFYVSQNNLIGPVGLYDLINKTVVTDFVDAPYKTVPIEAASIQVANRAELYDAIQRIKNSNNHTYVHYQIIPFETLTTLDRDLATQINDIKNDDFSSYKKTKYYTISGACFGDWHINTFSKKDKELEYLKGKTIKEAYFRRRTPESPAKLVDIIFTDETLIGFAPNKPEFGGGIMCSGLITFEECKKASINDK